MITENKLKEITSVYNSIARLIDGISHKELTTLLRAHRIPYPLIVIKVLVDQGKLIKQNKRYRAIPEPVYYGVFKLAIDKAYEYARLNYRAKKEQSPDVMNIPVKSEKLLTSNYSVLKELIQKGVSDEAVLTLFPDLK